MADKRAQEGGALGADPELRQKVLNSILRLAAAGALGGAAARTGMSVLRNANPRYNPPSPAKPLVVDMPYPVDRPVLGLPATDPRKETRLGGKPGGKSAADAAAGAAPVPPIPTVPPPSVSPFGMLSPAAAKPAGLGAGLPLPPTPTPGSGSPLDAAPSGPAPAAPPGPAGPTKAATWAGDFFEWLNRKIPYTSPLGNPGAQAAGDVPLTYALGIPAAVGGAGLGYVASDKILRAADRRRARNELEDAQREYQQAVLARLARTHLPAKSAADASPSGAAARIRAALDEAYDAVASAGTKAAQDGGQDGHAGRQLLMRALFPGLALGPTAAAANMGLVGALAGMGGYAGYNFARDDNAAERVRKEIRKIDQANAQKLPSPLIARLVPVQRQVS